MNCFACGFSAVKYADNANNIPANRQPIAFLRLCHIGDGFISGHSVYVQNLLKVLLPQANYQPAAI